LEKYFRYYHQSRKYQALKTKPDQVYYEFIRFPEGYDSIFSCCIAEDLFFRKEIKTEAYNALTVIIKIENEGRI